MLVDPLLLDRSFPERLELEVGLLAHELARLLDERSVVGQLFRLGLSEAGEEVPLVRLAAAGLIGGVSALGRGRRRECHDDEAEREDLRNAGEKHRVLDK